MSKYLTFTVAVEVPDGADAAQVRGKIHRSLAHEFPAGNSDVFSGVSSEHASVKAFDAKFLVPNSTVPAWLDPAAANFRHKFIQEEKDELLEAYAEGNMAKYFDALLDLAWVTHGTATMMGLPWGMGWRNIDAANMAKERATGADDPRSKRKSALDVVKPEGWKEPNHSLVIGMGPFPVMDTTLAGIKTVQQLETNRRPSNKFDPADSDSVFFMAASLAKATQQPTAEA
jgi:predicted HAD superfamily Cof-like phosphohydrolase